jgi:transposase
MAVTTMAHPGPTRVTVGVDTHGDVHVAHAGDQLGRRLDTVSVPTTPAGYRDLLAWARGFGELDAWGVEGTGAYGAGLARFLRDHGQVVVEVNRPDRAARRRRGKSDPVDAEAAARAVQAGEATVLPKVGTGQVEMIRSLRVARASAMKARTQAINAIKALLVSAPDDLRQQLRGLSVTQLVRTAARLRPGAITTPTAAAKLALRTLAERHQTLSAEIKDLDTELDRLTATTAARLVALFGVGTDSAGALLVAAGDNPDRLRSEGAFSMLCGSSPIEASSGKTIRHRPRPWRRPPGQRRAVPHRDGAPALRPHHPGLHGQAPHAGQVQAGGHPLPQALRGQGGLRSPVPDQPEQARGRRLTSIGASNTAPPATPLVSGPVIRLPGQHGKVRRDGYRKH